MRTVRTVTSVISAAPAGAFQAFTGAGPASRMNGSRNKKPEKDGFWPLLNAILVLQCRIGLRLHPKYGSGICLYERRNKAVAFRGSCLPRDAGRRQKTRTAAGRSGTGKTGLPNRMIGRDGRPRPCGGAGSSLNYIIPKPNHPRRIDLDNIWTIRTDLYIVCDAGGPVQKGEAGPPALTVPVTAGPTELEV